MRADGMAADEDADVTAVNSWDGDGWASIGGKRSGGARDVAASDASAMRLSGSSPTLVADASNGGCRMLRLGVCCSGVLVSTGAQIGAANGRSKSPTVSIDGTVVVAIFGARVGGCSEGSTIAAETSADCCRQLGSVAATSDGGS